MVGASANNFLMQFQSDILNIGIKRPYCIETTIWRRIWLDQQLVIGKTKMT